LTSPVELVITRYKFEIKIAEDYNPVSSDRLEPEKKSPKTDQQLEQMTAGEKKKS